MRAGLAWSGLHADAAMAGCIAAGAVPVCDYYTDKAGATEPRGKRPGAFGGVSVRGFAEQLSITSFACGGA
jgi:hypothetical protein